MTSLNDGPGGGGAILPPVRSDAICLIVRTDGSFDYRYADGYRDRVIPTLRDIADKIETGAVTEHPH